MGIYYGNIHYGIRISRTFSLHEDEIRAEPIFELMFSSHSDLEKVRGFYSTLRILEAKNDKISRMNCAGEYIYFVFVDICTTYSGMQSTKGWQPITSEQMADFVKGNYKIGFHNKTVKN